MSLNLREPADGQVVSNPAVLLASKGPCSLDRLFPVFVEDYSCVVGNTALTAGSLGLLSSGQGALRALLLMNMLGRPESFYLPN